VDSQADSCSTAPPDPDDDDENSRPVVIRKSGKEKMHARNRFRSGYDFKELTRTSPALARFVRPNPWGDISVDFADPEAVKALNQALLAHAYGVKAWDLPQGYLCPPIPGRSDYLHHLADLIADGDAIPRGPGVTVLDIGTGASAAYPLIGTSEYGWRFVGSEVDSVALRWAQGLVQAQAEVRGLIEIRAQSDSTQCFKGVILPGEFFTATMCNPPFHGSAAEAFAGNLRKRLNLRAGKPGVEARNFGGRAGELWCPGGELGFALRMIGQSVAVHDRCRWFTILVSKSVHLPRLREALEAVNVAAMKTIDMGQGQKQSRLLAWTFREAARPRV
jgi:23S rRNA (adenine1618-N6)-methyltransferase